MNRQQVYEFGPFRLDTANHRLLRDGVPVALKPKALDTLRLLVENAGSVVSKDEMFGRLWPGTSVEEASLTQNIYELRRALADPDREHRYIETIPKRGYRFVAALSSGSRSRTGIAVLPFRLLSAGAGHEYLGVGIADALVAALTTIPSLAVRPLSSIAGTAASRDPFAAGRAAGAALVVDGTLQTAGERIRVSVRLLDVASEAVAWAGTFDETLGAVFTLQDTVAARVAAAVGGEPAAIPSKRSTGNAAAYQLYLKGRYNWNKVTPEALWKAIEFFRAAIEADPGYALAYVGLSDAYTSLDWYGVLATRDSNPLALAAARKALEIDDTLAEAHASMAMAKQYAWEWEDAEREYQRAIALNPAYAPAWQWYGVFLAFMAQFDEALIRMRRAQELDPVSLSIGAQTGLVLMLARRYDDAESQLRQLLEVDAESIEGRFMFAINSELLGKTAEAIEIYRGLPPDNPDFAAMLAHACASAGRIEEAWAIVRGLETRGTERHVALFWLAVAFVALGEHDQALLCLERACDDPDDSLLAVAVFAMLDPIRNEPRFQEVLRRMAMGRSVTSAR